MPANCIEDNPLGSRTSKIGLEFTYKRRIYQFCTGYENEPFTCWWCNTVFSAKRQRQFCSDPCGAEYGRHFYWNEASRWCRKRAASRCQVCGLNDDIIEHSYGYRSRLEVHHIVHINGGDRFVNPLNIPCNLLLLCQACHNKTKKKLKNMHKKSMQMELIA